MAWTMVQVATSFFESASTKHAEGSLDVDEFTAAIDAMGGFTEPGSNFAMRVFRSLDKDGSMEINSTELMEAIETEG